MNIFKRLFCLGWMIFCVCFPFGVVFMVLYLPALILVGSKKADSLLGWSRNLSDKMMCGCDEYLATR